MTTACPMFGPGCPACTAALGRESQLAEGAGLPCRVGGLVAPPTNPHWSHHDRGHRRPPPAPAIQAASSDRSGQAQATWNLVCPVHGTLAPWPSSPRCTCPGHLGRVGARSQHVRCSSSGDFQRPHSKLCAAVHTAAAVVHLARQQQCGLISPCPMTLCPAFPCRPATQDMRSASTEA